MTMSQEKNCLRNLASGVWVPLLVLGLAGNAGAQQLPRQSQFVQNPYLVNPAFAGTELGTFASLSHREQWTGFHGARKALSSGP